MTAGHDLTKRYLAMGQSHNETDAQAAFVFSRSDWPQPAQKWAGSYSDTCMNLGAIRSPASGPRNIFSILHADNEKWVILKHRDIPLWVWTIADKLVDMKSAVYQIDPEIYPLSVKAIAVLMRCAQNWADLMRWPPETGTHKQKCAIA